MIAAPASRRALVGLSGAVGFATLLVLALALLGSPRVKPGPTELKDSQVVAVLQQPRAVYSDDLRARLQLARSNPEDIVAAKDAARGLIDAGRAAGDSRLVGAGLGVLRRFLDGGDAEALFLAATARQYQHDFIGALELLDQAIVLAPNDAGAILSRATVTIVRGDLAAAADDCRRLGALGRVDLALLCQTTARLLTAAAPADYDRLAGVLAIDGLLDPGLRDYAVALMGEIAMLQGWVDVARGRLEAAVAADPGAIRARMMLADLLITAGDNRAALQALAGAPDVDGVVLRRAMAAAGLGDAAAAETARTELAGRFRQNLDLGLNSHAREEARYFLQVAPDPDLALQRAMVNWGFQREIEDAQLLIDAAVAAGKPAAAAPVVAWIAAEQVSIPTLRIPAAVLEAAR